MVGLPLAALTFTDPLLLVGFLAAAIPVFLHLLNRVRSPIVQFPTLRFLRITAQKTSRKRQIQQFVLLLMRMAVFALIAMAIAGPLVHGGTPGLAYGMIVVLLLGLGAVALAIVMLLNHLESFKAGAGQVAESSTIPTPKIAGQRPHGNRFPVALVGLLGLGIVALLAALLGLTTNTFFPASAVHFDGENAAVVIILDNSQSMLMRAGPSTRLSESTTLVRHLLLHTLHPAQMAVLLTNPGDMPVPENLSANRLAVVGRLAHISSDGRALPMALLVTRATHMLAQSTLPQKVLVLVSDFAGPAASDSDMFAALKKIPGIQLVLMPQATGNLPDDVAIASFHVVHGQAVVGSNVMFQARVVNNGQTAVVPRFELRLDGHPIADSQTKIPLGPAGTRDAKGHVKLRCQLTAAGSHVIAIHELTPSGAMPWADHRRLVLKVADQVKALVVGNATAPPPGSTAFYVDAALSPFTGGGSAASGRPWSIKPRNITLRDLTMTSLTPFGAIFFCDVPRLSVRQAQRVARFVHAGGRVCWMLGPRVDPASYNSILMTKNGLLPGAIIGPIASIRGSAVDHVDTKSYLCGNLFQSQRPFERIIVANRWGLSPDAPMVGRAVCALANAAPLIVDQAAGKGRIYTFFSGPAGGWSNIATTSAFLPMMVRIALGNAAGIARLGSYQPAAAIDLPLPSTLAPMSADVTVPGSAVPINVKPVRRGSHRWRWVFTNTHRSGVYHWTSFNQKYSGMFVVNPPGSEADLHSTSAHVLAKLAKVKHPVLIATTASGLLAVIKKSNAGSSLMPGILALVAILAVLEALAANRSRPAKLPTVADSGPPRADHADETAAALQTLS